MRVSEFQIDTGNTAWMLAAAGLVLFMTPGLAFFYGGLTRDKNVVGTIMHSFITIGVVAVLWVVVGYSLAFGPDQGLGLIGNLDHVGLKGVGVDTGSSGVPDLLFMAFQMMFAIITPALITGGFAERAKFGPFLLFIALWSVIVYAPVAHWVFGTNGWLNHFSDPEDIGINGLDFAGGLAIHINAGVAALAAVLVFGNRKGYGVEPMEPHDITMVVLGAAMLWFGWFGFNAGSALAANGQAVYAFVATAVAAGAGALSWTLVSWWFGGRRHEPPEGASAPERALAWFRRSGGKPSVVGGASGAVAGLVAITPASGYVQPVEAGLIGIGAGVVCYFAVLFRQRVHFDDSLDVVAVHGVGGLWGAIATGIFATAAAGAPEFREGLIHGQWELLRDQVIGIVAVGAWSFVLTYAILKGLDRLFGVRVSEEDEEAGLDLSQHGERAYAHDEAGIAFPGGVMASRESGAVVSARPASAAAPAPPDLQPAPPPREAPKPPDIAPPPEPREAPKPPEIAPPPEPREAPKPPDIAPPPEPRETPKPPDIAPPPEPKEGPKPPDIPPPPAPREAPKPPEIPPPAPPREPPTPPDIPPPEGGKQQE